MNYMYSTASIESGPGNARRIIAPGTTFVVEDENEVKRLLKLKGARAATEAEIALYEQQEEARQARDAKAKKTAKGKDADVEPSKDDDKPARGRGRGKSVI